MFLENGSQNDDDDDEDDDDTEGNPGNTSDDYDSDELECEGKIVIVIRRASSVFLSYNW